MKRNKRKLLACIAGVSLGFAGMLLGEDAMTTQFSFWLTMGSLLGIAGLIFYDKWFPEK